MPVNFFIFELFPETFLEPKLHPCPYHPKSQISSPSLPTYSKLLQHYLHLDQLTTIFISFPQLNLSMFILIGILISRKKEIENQVETMLQCGVIRPSTNPFSSRVLLVKKRDNTWQFVLIITHSM